MRKNISCLFAIFFIASLVGCGENYNEKKCIENFVYYRQGAMWKKSYPEHRCFPVEESK